MSDVDEVRRRSGRKVRLRMKTEWEVRSYVLDGKRGEKEIKIS